MKHSFFVLALFLTINVVQAQADQLDEPWPIVERCMSLENTPPDDWSFDGTLVMTSQQGLHAYRYAWETPRITAFFTRPLSAALSPDARWYAIVEGTSIADGIITRFTTRAIRVYDTFHGETHHVSWDNRYIGHTRLVGHQLYWVDNTHVLYSKDDTTTENEIWFQINPFTDEIIPWTRLNPRAFVFYLSPDAHKGIYFSWAQPEWTIRNGDIHTTLSRQVTLGAAWHPTSEFLVVSTSIASSDTLPSLLMLDLTGEVEHHIYQASKAPRDGAWGLDTGVWSADGRYLAFSHERLLIADLQNKVVWDTCVNVGSLVWSPSGDQIAAIEYRGQQGVIRILDLLSLQSYVVGISSGRIIGWRADDTEE